MSYGSSLAAQYSKWEAVSYDSDEEDKGKDKAARKKRSDDARAAVAAHQAAERLHSSLPPTEGASAPVDQQALDAAYAAGKAANTNRVAAGPRTMMQSGASLSPNDMTDDQRAQFAQKYAEMIGRTRPSKKEYKFPETWDEQVERTGEADELRQKGNALFKKGQLTEAAKLYEQAVLKFSVRRRSPRSLRHACVPSAFRALRRPLLLTRLHARASVVIGLVRGLLCDARGGGDGSRCQGAFTPQPGALLVAAGQL